jgi:hypothetical protein
MSQQKDESAKDFIERTRNYYKRGSVSVAADLPRTMFDPDKITFTKDNHNPRPTVYEREEKHQDDRYVSYRDGKRK